MKFLLSILLLVVISFTLSSTTVSAFDAEIDAFDSDAFHRHFSLKGAGDEWNYDRTSTAGPNNWGDIVQTCNTDVYRRQTPINIITHVDEDEMSPNQPSYDSTLLPLHVSYAQSKWTGVTLAHNGHAIMVNAPTTGIQSIRNGAFRVQDQFDAIQFHFHSPSEHTINGAQYPLELHIVHKNSNPELAVPTNPKELAVIGIFFEESEEESEFLAPIVAKLSAIQKALDSTTVTVDFATLFTEELLEHYITYDGSLTTPNCRETVTWHVLEQPVKASGAQLQQLRSVLGGDLAVFGNARPTLPVNARVVRTNNVHYPSINGSDDDTTTTCTGNDNNNNNGNAMSNGGNGQANVVNINFANMFQGMRV